MRCFRFKDMLMKTTRSEWIITVLLFCLLLIALVARAAPVTQKNSAKKPEKTVLIFERKPCYGFCPAYKAEFFASGLVLVTAMQHVKLAEQPEFRFQLPPAEIQQLAAQAKKSGFFAFPERIKTKATDIPARELTIFQKNKPKKVVFEETPESFKEVTDQLESTVESRINPGK